jgi:hypothetical protein
MTLAETNVLTALSTLIDSIVLSVLYYRKDTTL